MMSREWLTTFLAARLTRARVEVDRPVIPMAEEMTVEVLDKWFESEVAFWLAQAGKPGMTVQQRTIRLNVSRFYEQRLLAHRAVNPREEDPP